MVTNLEFWKVKLLLTFCYLLHALIYDYYTPAPSGLVVIFHQHRLRHFRVKAFRPYCFFVVLGPEEDGALQVGALQVGAAQFDPGSGPNPLNSPRSAYLL